MQQMYQKVTVQYAADVSKGNCTICSRCYQKVTVQYAADVAEGNCTMCSRCSRRQLYNVQQM